MHRDVQRLLREYQRRGWCVTRTSKSLRLIHPGCPGDIVMTAITPSDNRAIRNMDAMIRRVERKHGVNQ